MHKMPIYARYGRPHLWLIDPVAKTLDVFRLKNGEWVVAGLFVEGAKMRGESFAEIEIDLNDFWQESRPGRPGQSPEE